MTEEEIKAVLNTICKCRHKIIIGNSEKWICTNYSKIDPCEYQCLSRKREE